MVGGGTEAGSDPGGWVVAEGAIVPWPAERARAA